jgi:hypothetical protein
MKQSCSNALYPRPAAGAGLPLHERHKGHDSVRKLEALPNSEWFSAGARASVQATQMGQSGNHRHVICEIASSGHEGAPSIAPDGRPVTSMP